MQNQHEPLTYIRPSHTDSVSMNSHPTIRGHTPSLSLVFLALALASARAQTDLPPPMRPEVKALIEDYETDAPYGDVQRWAAVERELATRPDIKEDLLNEFKRSLIRANARSNVAASMSLLALRADLTAEEQKLVTDELERVSAFPYAVQKAGFADVLFISPAIHLLRHYPSPEHEALVLRFLDREDRDEGVLLTAFRTLSIIGGPKSLKTMVQMAASIEAARPKSVLFRQMKAPIEQLEARLKAQATKADPKSAPVIQVEPEKGAGR